MTIYIDVLIILNVYVNFFLLSITAKLTGSPLKPLRCIIASFYGSFYSLLILAPQLPYMVNTAIKLAAAVTVVMTAFGIHGARRLIKNSAAFYGANFLLAGAVYGVYSWLKPSFMHFSNSYFYIDFSLIILIITTAVMYFIVCTLRRFCRSSDNEDFSVIIRVKGRIIKMKGLADTGNSLVDFFTGKPVIICSREDIGELPTTVKTRIIPVSTVSGEGIMDIFRPDEVIIIRDSDKERKPVDVMIGLGESESKAIFNPKIFFNF